LKADEEDCCDGLEGDDNDGGHDYVTGGGEHGDAVEEEADEDSDGA
jgi:hypothetical protein